MGGMSDLCIGSPRGWMSTSDYNEACSSRCSTPTPRRELTEERKTWENEGYEEVMAIIREFGRENKKFVNYSNFWVSELKGSTFVKSLSHGFKVYGTWFRAHERGLNLKITHYKIFIDGKPLKRMWKLKLLDS